MTKVKHWLEAFRLRTLPLALACIGMGGVTAAIENQFNSTVFFWAIITTVLLQILSNLANDFGDFTNGADNENRIGPQRTVQAGKISLQEMKFAIALFSILSFSSGIYLLKVADLFSNTNKLLFFIGLGIFCIIGALTYTAGKKPYGYAGLGDLAVFFFFGPVAGLGAYYLITSTLNYTPLLPSITCGLFATAVLNLNNMRDIENDKATFKNTIPVRIGRENANIYHIILISLGLLCSVVYTLIHYQHIFNYAVYVIITPILGIQLYRITKTSNNRDIDNFLKPMALSTLLYVILFALSFLIF